MELIQIGAPRQTSSCNTLHHMHCLKQPSGPWCTHQALLDMICPCTSQQACMTMAHKANHPDIHHALMTWRSVQDVPQPGPETVLQHRRSYQLAKEAAERAAALAQPSDQELRILQLAERVQAAALQHARLEAEAEV